MSETNGTTTTAETTTEAPVNRLPDDVKVKGRGKDKAKPRLFGDAFDAVDHKDAKTAAKIGGVKVTLRGDVKTNEPKELLALVAKQTKDVMGEKKFTYGAEDSQDVAKVKKPLAPETLEALLSDHFRLLGLI